MPKIEIKRTPFREAMFHSKDKTDKEREKIAAQHGHRYLGWGAGSVVFVDNPESHAIAVFNKGGNSPKNVFELKRQFYHNRIYHTIFPNNFPRIYAVFGKESESHLPGIVREEIKKCKGIPKGRFFLWIRTLGHGKAGLKFKDFNDVVKEAKKIGVPFFYDRCSNNFIRDEKTGCEKYVDPYIGFNAELCDVAEVEKKLRRKGYGERDIRTVVNAINRLKQLKKEEREERAKKVKKNGNNSNV